MKFSRVCHECGSKSDTETEFCPECGTAKQEKFIDITFYSSVVKYFAKKIPNFDNAEMFVGLIINLLLLLIGIILVNPLIESSDLLWIFFLLYTIQGIAKEISVRVHKLKKLHIVSKGLIFLYIGSGIGNLISYAGKNHSYYLSYFFYPDTLLKEFNNGNGLIIIGALFGIIFMMILRYVYKFLK